MGPPPGGSQSMSLKFRLASRNLFHDRLRFVATIVGIVFSIVLVTVQLGLYAGFRAHGHDHDRSRPGRSLDHAERHQMLRRSLAARRAPAFPGAGGQGGDRRDPARHRLCAMAAARRHHDASLHGRRRARHREPAALERGRRPARRPRHPRRGGDRKILFRPARGQRPRRQRRDPRSEGPGGGGDQGHPLVHDHALCFHRSRSRPRLYRDSRQQGLLPAGAASRPMPMSTMSGGICATASAMSRC